jgi:NDP-sugar pyrophosphorylase family protein
MGNNCQVLLLATSETKKLEPLTLTMPTPMVPLANKPIMAYPIEVLARQGFKQIYVSLYNMANQVEAYFGSGERWGLQLDYILQHKPWGSAGALKWAEGNLKDTVIVLPADSLVDVDLTAAIKSHFSKEAKVTMVVSPCKMRAVQPLWLDPQGYITSTAEGSNHQPEFFDTGVYIFDASLLELIPPRTQFDIQTQLISSLQTTGIQINAYQTDGYWNPLETFGDYHAAQQEYLRAGQKESPESETGSPPPSLKHPFVLSTKISEGIWVGRNNLIHPNAMIAPPVIIGDHCRIGKDVEIGPSVVVGSNVVIDEGASIKESTIIDYTYVGKLVNIDNRLVNKNLIINTITGEHTEITDNFLLGPLQQSNIGHSFNRLVNLFISFVLLCIFSPILVVIAILNLITTGHIFRTTPRSKSTGAAGNSFRLIRFYTRKPNGKPTWLGKWLEAVEFHRLPELINVVIGDLSMVGVKPLPQEALDQIQEEWQQKRFECPAGITGMWYIHTDRNSTLDEVLVADAYYAATRNWREDAKLMWKTIATWFRRNLIKGPSSNQS